MREVATCPTFQRWRHEAIFFRQNARLAAMFAPIPPEAISQAIIQSRLLFHDLVGVSPLRRVPGLSAGTHIAVPSVRPVVVVFVLEGSLATPFAFP